MQALRAIAWAAALLAPPAVTAAGIEFHPYAASQYEFDSNVYSLSSREQAIALNGDAARADSSWRNLAGIDAAYGLGQSKLSADAEGRRVLYDRFSQLDHDEYLLSGAFGWKALSAWDGNLAVRQERRMASFANRISTQLSLERDRNASAGVNVNVAPDWRIETSAVAHQLDSPLPGFPDFSLREDTGNVALKYLGLAGLTSGVLLTYTDGRFRGVPDSPAYTQLTGVVTVSYVVSGISTVDGNVGYTRFRSRDSNGEKVSGLSGALGWTARLTGKTDVHLRAYRRVNSYVAGADAVIDSGAETGVNWQATTKIGVAAGYEWTYSAYRALAPLAPSDSNRRDHYQAANLGLSYAALDWLTLRTYGNYYNRHSDIDVDSFNQALAGVELRLRLP
ncbi:MAG: outer membrane beta-barrel protein [Nevskia sp.]|nr:outer membrane beta-barrel protein [Nevskia sp.]